MRIVNDIIHIQVNYRIWHNYSLIITSLPSTFRLSDKKALV